jgi:hypothetical protein
VEKQRRVQLGQFNPNFSNWRRGVWASAVEDTNCLSIHMFFG